MSKRLELHSLLKQIPTVKNAYFQPPESIKLQYPCIIYSKEPPATRRADNTIYNNRERYRIIVIDPDPDSEIPDYILYNFKMSRIDRYYVSDNLNHTILTLYF